MIELYRTVIPYQKIINDNHGQHYRIHMGNLDWLTKQFESIRINERETPGSFKMPSINEVKEYVDSLPKNALGNPNISIRCEVWRCRNTLFDPQNYAKTFKAPIDLLVHNGYISDDNWKFINGITYVGGGRSVWAERAVRHPNDGLPDDLSPDWWTSNCSDDFNDIFIRIFI